MTPAIGKRAMVLGSDGQDGSFLVEKLLARGYEVAAIGRRAEMHRSVPRLRRIVLDLTDSANVAAAIAQVAPDIIFHFAAVHGSAGTRYESVWQDMWRVNTAVVHACLEYLRKERPDAVLIYAGSCKIFGPDYPALVSEESPVRSTCLYTVTKNAALDLVRCYRRDHGVKASVLHLFHHESERRAPTFFIPKLVTALHGAMTDKTFRVEFDTLQFYGDWGFAAEYMDAAIGIGELELSTDLIIATGETWSAQELAEKLFERKGLDAGQHLVERHPEYSNPRFSVSIRTLQQQLGWTPKIKAVETCERILALRFPGLPAPSSARKGTSA